MNERDKNFLNDTMKRKPRMLFPIINTIFSIGFVVFVIYLTLEHKLEGWILVIALILAVLYPLSSWYNSYFSRLKNTELAYNIHEETELMMKYAKTLHKKTQYELTSEEHLDFLIEYNDDIELRSFAFDYKSRTFQPLQLEDSQLILMSLCISFGGLAIDLDKKQAIGAIGMAPCSIWTRRRVEPPFAKKGKVFIDFKNFKIHKDVMFKYLDRQEIYYNRITGWLCFGNFKLKNDQADVVEIAKDLLLVIQDKDLVALWIKIDPELIIR